MYEVPEANQNMSAAELWHNIKRQGWGVMFLKFPQTTKYTVPQ